MDLVLLVELGSLGLIAGFLAGLLGIGGGMIMVPILAMLLDARGINHDLSIKMGIATAMATIVFTSMSSVRAHHRHGAVRWDLVRGIAPGIVIGALVASVGVFAVLKGQALGLLFAGFVSFSATQMFLDKKPTPGRQMPGSLGQIGAGSVVGFVSGLVGAGGGFISVPFMTWCNVAIHNAVATSAALGFPIAIANTLGFIWSGMGVADRPPFALGYVWMPALAVIASCSVLTAPWGARSAHRYPVRRLKRIFASVLYLLAGYMAYRSMNA